MLGFSISSRKVRGPLWVHGAAILLFASLFAGLQASVAIAETNGVDSKKAPRKLAPGIETTIAIARETEETGERHDVVEMLVGKPGLEWNPKNALTKAETLHAKSTGTFFRRGIWHLQFTFKPLRMIRIDIPQPGGKMKQKLIWYMVYRINNPGAHMTPVEGEVDKFSRGQYSIDRVDTAEDMLASVGPHRFIPRFSLRTIEDESKRVKEYNDVIVPLAMAAIHRREQPPVPLSEFHNTITISQKPIPVGTKTNPKSVWGVVTWMDLDPTIDYFSIYLQGLTNAYRWSDPEGGYKPGDKPGEGRKFIYKTLKLNFTRHGDEFNQREEEIRYGITGEVDYQWVYR